MRPVELTMALSGYHHTDALVTGAVTVEGVDLTVLTLPIEEIFFRWMKFREWHVSEMSLAKYVALKSHGDDSYVGLPVFPSRSFRHSSLYVRSNGAEDPRQLIGGRIGLPEWAQTAAVYTRALLAEEYGVRLTDVEWVQAGVFQAGRAEKVEVTVPEGVTLTRVTDRTLDSMLRSGEVDAVMTAHAPPSFESGSREVRRLFSNCDQLEREYGRRTGIFPIMHLMALRADVHAAHPWLAGNLVSAFEAAKHASYELLTEATASRIPLAWLASTLESANSELFGGQHWPYGIEPNRPTLAGFARWAFEQGVAVRELSPEEMFPPETRLRYAI